MITIYPADCTDFSTNGLGTLIPSSCTVAETLNGIWEVNMVHPIDEYGKWTRLQVGNIIRVPVPSALTPYVKMLDHSVTIETSSRGTYTAPSGVLRDAPSLQGKIYDRDDFGYKKWGVLGTTENGWYKVLTDNGITGYMYPQGMTKVKTLTTVEEVVGEIVESRQLRDQPFRIYRIVPSLKGVTVYARHIFYDLLDSWITSYSNEGGNYTGADVAKRVLAASLDNMGITMYSDLTSRQKEFELENVNVIDAYLGENGVINTYGGELARDWYDAFIVERVGDDTNILIAEAKNLKGINYDVDDTNVITRIIPTGQTKDGKTLFLPEKYITSPNASNYVHYKYTSIAVSDAKVGTDGVTEAQAYEKMRQAANDEFEAGCDMPTVTLIVDFLNCADTEEYKQYGFLQNIYIGDTVRVQSDTLGIDVSMRMTQYTYDCLLEKYTKMSLGTVADTIEANTISSKQIGTASITGSKLAINTIDAANLKDGSVRSLTIQAAAIEAAHISQAAIETLTANAITAYRADIQKIAAGEIKVDSLVAALADITALHVGNLTAKDIEADRLGAALAAFTVLTAGAATFDKATVKHLIASALNVQDAVGENVFISNLAIDYAAIANADVRNLCIKADDGQYYALVVDSKGNVSATPQALSSGEIESGKTRTGQTIIDTNIVASELSATNFKAVQALINKIDAARIDVDELFASKAFISHLETADLSSNTSIKMSLNGVNKLWRSETEPSDAWINDMWVVPSTGYIYQYTEKDVDLSGYSFEVTNDGILIHTTSDETYVLSLDDDGILTMDYSEDTRITFKLEANGSMTVIGMSWERVKDGELTIAQRNALNALDGVEEVTGQIELQRRYIEYSDDGLIQKLPNSIYYTLIDNYGFNVKSEEEVDAIATMNATEGVKVKQLTIGEITCRATSTGGWAWNEVMA